MSVKLKDGTGTGKVAKVDSFNRLATSAITETQADHHAETGDRYNINTGDIALTTAGETSVLYLKNNEDKDLVINAFIYNIGNSVDACCAAITGQDILVDIYRNPTVGTVVCCTPTDVQMNLNMNFSSSKTLVVDAYKGAEGETLTDGVIAIASRFNGVGRKVVSLGAVILPKGSSIGVKVTPPTGNASMTVQVAAALFLQTLEA